MEHTNLQRVLRKFSKAEWRKFGDFVASPYFNKNEKFRKFHELLNPFFGDFEVDDQQKEEIFRIVTNSTSFNDASYRNLCSDFLELVLNFLSHEYFQIDNTGPQHALSRALMDKELYDIVERTVKKTIADITKGKFDVNEKLRSDIWINDMVILLSIYTNRSRINASNELMANDATYKVVTEWALVKIYNSFLNNIKGCKNIGIEPQKDVIHSYLTLYEQIRPFKNPVVDIYHLIVLMTITGNDSAYYEARSLFTENQHQIHSKNYENILIGLLDYANEKASYDESWRNELYELYELKFTSRLWNANKDLSYASLYNAFMNALQMSKFEYAEEVVRSNIEFVHPVIRSAIEQLCFAWSKFYRGDTDGAHELLSTVETENLLIKFELRTLQSLIYFKKKEWDVLASYLESFRHFVLYNKTSVDTIVTDQFGNFCKYLSAISKLSLYARDKEKEKLVQQINKEPHVYLRNWLLEQLKT